MAAAVGSLMIRRQFRPAIEAASLVACRCASLKYAGTVTTASVTFLPVKDSATYFILVSTIEEISSGSKRFVSPLNSISIVALPALPDTTL
jgi:hypothetical protein